MIGAVLLAAGGSRRFGSDKLLAPLPDGTPVAVAAAATLVRASSQVIAVVRPGADALVEALHASGAQAVICPNAAEGMGTSLACGVAAASGWDGWLIALADMPFVSEQTVRAVVAAVAEGAALAAPSYRGTRGHPVCFGAAYRQALLALRGERGGRELVATVGDRLRRIDCDDPGVLADIDHPADLERCAAWYAPRGRG